MAVGGTRASRLVLDPLVLRGQRAQGQSTENGDTVVGTCFCLVMGRRSRQQGLPVLSFSCLVLSEDRTKFLSGSSLSFQGKVSHPLPVVSKQGREFVVVWGTRIDTPALPLPLLPYSLPMWAVVLFLLPMMSPSPPAPMEVAHQHH